MAAQDYNKYKEISPTSTNDPGSTINKAQHIGIIGEVTPKEFDGFEDGDYTASPQWMETVANGTATVQTTTVKNGSNALELNVTSGSGDEVLSHDRSTSDGISDGDQYQTWIRADANTGSHFGLSNGSTGFGTSDYISAALASNGDFRLFTGDGTGSQITAEVGKSYSLNTWYLFNITVYPSRSEARLEVYDINLNLIETLTATTSGVSNLQYSYLQSFDQASGSAFFDDASYSTTDSGTATVSESKTGNGYLVLNWDNIADESDMAVYYSDGTLAPYEIEDFDPVAETATIWGWGSWVRDDTPQAQIVYGDNTADKTIQETDGFEDGDFTSSPVWNDRQFTNGSAGDGTVTVQSTTVKNGSNGLEISTSGAGDQGLNHDRGASDGISDGDIYSAWVRQSNTTNVGCYLGLLNEDSSNPATKNDGLYIAMNDSGNFEVATYDSTGSNIVSRELSSYNANTWYRYEIELHPSSSTADFKVYDSTGTMIDRIYDVDTSGASNLQYLAIHNNDVSATNCYFDDVSYSATSTETLVGVGVDRQDVTGTWNNTGQNTVMVQHLQDDPLTATDSTSNNNDGTVTGAVSTTGQFGSAGSFDGTDDEVTVSHTGGLSPSDVTVLVWFSWDGTGSSNERITAINDTDSGYELLKDNFNNNDESLDWKIQDTAGSSIHLDGTNSIPADGKPVLGVGTFDSSNNTQELYTSISGFSLENSQTTSNAMGSGSTVDLAYGSRGGAAYWPGDIDELKIYSEAKNAAFLQAEYDASPKAGQVFFSQSAAQQTSLEISAPESKVTSSNPSPAVNATGSATVSGQVTTVNTSNPEPGISGTGSTSINAVESNASTSNPEPAITGSGSASISAGVTTVTVSNPEPSLRSSLNVSAPVTTANTSNPSPSISATGSATVEANFTKVNSSSPEPGISGSGTVTVDAVESNATVTSEEPSISGSGSTSLKAKVSAVTVSTNNPSLSVSLVPRDQNISSKITKGTDITSSIKTEDNQTLDGDIE